MSGGSRPNWGVSDHALVRYLERYQQLDFDNIRQKLRAAADESVPIPGADGQFRLHEESGTVLIVDREGNVVTVYDRASSAKILGENSVLALGQFC